ncbi:hypothetical protein P3S67_016178 [Capsicum chacoense]
MIRHNLDVMHIKKNFFDNVFNNVLNFDDKTKDNPQSRLDMAKYCDRPQSGKDSNGQYPIVVYTLDKEARAILFNWVKCLKFPDGYVSNLGRLSDTNAKRLFGMKSHDCHVFMQRLMPIAFRELLPSNVWQELTELSLFFMDLTSITLRMDDMVRLERDIPQILCKLERIFTPGFFDSIKHLPVHFHMKQGLLDLYNIDGYILLKASVEGSICEAYLMMESTQLFSHYFEPHVMSRNHNVDRNYDGGVVEDLKGNLSIFSRPGRLWGEAKKRDLILDEIKVAQTYILLKCEEVEPFVSMYLQYLKEEFSNLSQREIDESLEENFTIWFKGYARCNPIENEYLRSLARGPLIGATSHSVYFVNEYKFHTECHGSMRSIMNSGVYVGVKKHDRYKLADINHRRRYKKYEPFILAMQATEVCYVPYPSKKKDKKDWLAVLKVKPQNVIELPVEEVVITSELNVPFQVEEVEVQEIDMSVSVDEDILLHDPNGGVLEMNEPLNDGLFEEHHEIQDGCTEEEYETEETEEEDEEEEFEEDIDNMTRGGFRAGKSTGRSKAANHAKIPSIPAPVIEQDDTSSIPTMPPDQTPIIPETSPVSPNQRSPIGQIMNAQSNTAAESTSNQRKVSASGDFSCNNGRTLIFLTSSGLELSSKCSSSITLSFKSEVDPNGINWKGVSQDVKDGYFGEFKALKIGRDPTPSELHLHVHTHNHDGKSFVGERSRLLHERYEEIIREKVQCESEIDQLETYYEAAGGAKKKRLFDLGSETTSYFGKKLCACNVSTSSVPPSISLPTTNMEELVKQLIPALTTHFLPIVIERVGGTRVQDGVVLHSPPTHDNDDDIDS